MKKFPPQKAKALAKRTAVIASKLPEEAEFKFDGLSPEEIAAAEFTNMLANLVAYKKS